MAKVVQARHQANVYEKLGALRYFTLIKKLYSRFELGLCCFLPYV